VLTRAFGYLRFCLVIRSRLIRPTILRVFTSSLGYVSYSYALCASQLCRADTPRVSAKYRKSSFRPATSVKYIPSGWLFFQFRAVLRSEIRETLYSLLSLPRIPNPTPFWPRFIQLPTAWNTSTTHCFFSDSLPIPTSSRLPTSVQHLSSCGPSSLRFHSRIPAAGLLHQISDIFHLGIANGAAGCLRATRRRNALRA
jgi:hypothetical protein